MKRTGIKVNIKKTDLGYQGKIVVYENGKRLWTESSGIDRVTEFDAFFDANRLMVEALNENGLAGIIK